MAVELFDTKSDPWLQRHEDALQLLKLIAQRSPKAVMASSRLTTRLLKTAGVPANSSRLTSRVVGAQQELGIDLRQFAEVFEFDVEGAKLGTIRLLVDDAVSAFQAKFDHPRHLVCMGIRWWAASTAPELFKRLQSRSAGSNRGFKRRYRVDGNLKYFFVGVKLRDQ